jgi:hypothetical protein
MRDAMRAAAFQRLMYRLALAATLALVLVPALGRMAQAGHAAMPAPSHEHAASHQMASHDMASHAHHGASHAPASTPTPTPRAPHHGGSDCDYCPLLLSLVASKAPTVVAPAVAPSPAPMPVVVVAALPYRHPTGLRSRGPPTFS